MNFDIRTRYKNDPMFANLVNSLFVQIVNANYTPTEIREAAMLAQIMYEENKLPSYIIDKKLDAIDKIRE